MMDKTEHDDDPVWIVMSAVTVTKNNGSAFEGQGNAVGLTKVDAEREAQRRNIAEKRGGFKGIDWFVSMDPIEAMKLAGFDVSKVRGRG